MRFDELPDDVVMMMPDSVFGRQWWVTASAVGETGDAWGISHEPLPEKAMVWGLHALGAFDTAVSGIITWRLGDQLPTTNAMFDAMALFFGEIVNTPLLLSGVTLNTLQGQLWYAMRKPVAAAGRRLVVEVVQGGDDSVPWQVGVLVSGWPSGEVPSWLK